MTHGAIAASAGVMRPPVDREAGAGVYNEKLGMWVFLGSEVMFFTALIGSYIILRVAHPEMWAPPGKVLNVPITAVNTFLLICSSVTMVKAFASAQDGLQRPLCLWLLATCIIGATFVGVQAFEYHHLIEKGFVPSEGLSRVPCLGRCHLPVVRDVEGVPRQVHIDRSSRRGGGWSVLALRRSRLDHPLHHRLPDLDAEA
jgi:hypothetical protein